MDDYHGYCPAHSGIVTEQHNQAVYIADIHKEIKEHCNGNGFHVHRREVELIMAQLRELSERVEENRARSDKQRESKLAWWDKVYLALVSSICAAIVGYIMSHLG